MSGAVDQDADLGVGENQEVGAIVEREASIRWPLELVDDEVAEWHDARVDEEIPVPRDPSAWVAEGTLVEIKSCVPRLEDRRGRWWLRRRNHKRLLQAEGEYILTVFDRDAEEIVAMRMVPAALVDAKISRWWACGAGGQAATEQHQLPWSEIFTEDDLRSTHAGAGSTR
jgi:hypothetical protein